jgi:hypothetical protein
LITISGFQVGNASIESTNVSGLEFSTYVNDTHHYSINYPYNWEAGVPPNNTNSIRFHPPLSDNEDFVVFFVEVTNATKYLDPQDLQVKVNTARAYAQNEINELKSLSESYDMDEYDIVRDQPVTVGGVDGWKFDYIHSFLGFQGDYGLKIYVVKGETVYNLTFYSDALTVPKYLPIAEKMIDSFTFLN